MSLPSPDVAGQVPAIKRTPTGDPKPATISPFEKLYSVKELAYEWGRPKMEDTLRRIFLDEPGVLIVSHPRKGKRGFRFLLVPESVAKRVWQRLQNPQGHRRIG